MITLLQVKAIVALLLAFSVPQSTVDLVQQILTAPQATSSASVDTGSVAEVSTSTVSSVPQVSAPVSPQVQPIVPLEVYQLRYEDGMDDYYYAGNKALSDMSVDGVTGSTTMSRYVSDACWEVKDTPHCGAYVVRFTAPKGEQITVTSDDGQTYTK